MDSNVRAIHPPRVLDVRATQRQKERPQRDPSGKEFELDKGDESDSQPPDEAPSTGRGTAVSGRQEDEAGARLDLTA